MQLDDTAILYKDVRDLVMSDDIDVSNAERLAILDLIRNEMLVEFNKRIHNDGE